MTRYTTMFTDGCSFAISHPKPKPKPKPKPMCDVRCAMWLLQRLTATCS